MGEGIINMADGGTYVIDTEQYVQRDKGQQFCNF